MPPSPNVHRKSLFGNSSNNYECEFDTPYLLNVTGSFVNKLCVKVINWNVDSVVDFEEIVYF